MSKIAYNESLEYLISDLIFKLGKANQQIHHLTQRIEQLELYLQQLPVPPTQRINLLERH